VARLRPLDDGELATFLGDATRRFAEDLAGMVGVPADYARQRAIEDFAELWRGGRPGDGQAVYAVEDDDGSVVGSLWIGERDLHGRRTLWVWGVHVDAARRGRGFGRAAMQLAEEEARARGIRRVDFNVFGANDVARRLYRSLGYEELSLWMGKDLA
jgi:ribosomal protein S18 acetylase RimI-like enzyme